MKQELDKPVFLIGMGRGGSTMIFEVLAASPELGWFSRYLNLVPWFPPVAALSRLADVHPALRSSIGRSDQGGGWTRKLRRVERARLGPNEAYRVWDCCCEKSFAEGFLAVEAPGPERDRARALVSKVLRYQGKPRFVAKLTGPPRIAYLSSIFPDARFVHLIRDGRAVVQSLLKVPFWKDTFRLREPAWKGALTAEQLGRWEKLGRPPAALAALEWRRVIETARAEATDHAPGRYAELRYEDFLGDPHRSLDEIEDFCELSRDPKVHAFLARRYELRNMNAGWRSTLEPAEVEMLEELIGDLLLELGYEVPYRAGEPAPRRRSARLVRSFA
ncbi:MAG: sulfotransferase family protein [Thermoleophilaceae bacterium]